MTARRLGLNPVGLISVDLFGLPADYDAIEPICAREGLWLLSDAAQSFGATYKGRKVGTIGMATATSFFPAKPLGCYGDGGAVFTDDDELADVMRSLRVHGQGTDKYDNVRIGINGRLDTIQAAILIEKLKIFPDEIAARDRVARRYNELLRPMAIVPEVPRDLTSVWAQYTLRIRGFDRDAFQSDLKAAGIPTAVYYPKPLHRQTAYKRLPRRRQRAACVRAARRRGRQPADAPVPHRGGAGPHRARGQGRACPPAAGRGRVMARLAGIPLLKDAGVDLSRFEARSHWRRFEPDEILVDFDDLSTDIYFLLSGEVRVLIRTQSGKEVILGEMRGGQLFGELAAIDGVKRSANVTALTRGEVGIMPSAVFRELVFASQPVADRLLRLLAGRVRELNARLMEQAVLDLRHRLYSELLRMSAPRAGHGNERVVTPPPFHHVLAARIGCRREQVTREFTTMAGEGLVERTRGALVIKRPDVFEARVAEAFREDI